MDQRFVPTHSLVIESPQISLQAQTSHDFKNPSLKSTIKVPQGSIELLSKPTTEPPSVSLVVKPDLSRFGVSLALFPLNNGRFDASGTVPLPPWKWTYSYSTADQNAAVAVAYEKLVRGVKVEGTAKFSLNRQTTGCLCATYDGHLVKIERLPDPGTWGLGAKYATASANAVVGAKFQGMRVDAIEFNAGGKRDISEKVAGVLSVAGLWNGKSWVQYGSVGARLKEPNASICVGARSTGGIYVSVEAPKIGNAGLSATWVLPAAAATWRLGLSLKLTP